MELRELTRSLVAIPRHDDEAAAGDAIEEWLRAETDADVVRDDAPNGGNVIARRGAGEATLALVGHHDVVPPAEGQFDGDRYAVTERDGRLYGRGTADMTGALAAMLLAFRDADPATELAFASFVGEETGGAGARHAIDAGFAPEYAVVAEGSNGYSTPGVTDVAIAHRGRRGHTVTARGESAHASVPEEGDNAVYRACDVIDRLRAVEAPTVSLAGQELSGSLAVTGIEGGDAWNVIPDACTVTVDERTVPGGGDPLADVLEGPGLEWAVDQDLPPMQCDDQAFADATLAAAAAAQDGDPEGVCKPHATDAGWLDAAGTACVVCGPAEPGEAHTADESVSLSVLERCRRIYRRLAESGPEG